MKKNQGINNNPIEAAREYMRLNCKLQLIYIKNNKIIKK